MALPPYTLQDPYSLAGKLKGLPQLYTAYQSQKPASAQREKLITLPVIDHDIVPPHIYQPSWKSYAGHPLSKPSTHFKTPVSGSSGNGLRLSMQAVICSDVGSAAIGKPIGLIFLNS